MKRRKVGLATFVCVAMIFTQAFACNQSAYHSAVIAEHDFVTALQAFQQAELAEHTNGRIAADEHQRIEGAVEKIGNAAEILNASLQAGASNVTIQQNFNTISQSLDSQSGLYVIDVNSTSEPRVERS